MNPLLKRAAVLLMAATFTPALSPLRAFPPAPHHVIEGVVRDAYGNPLTAVGVAIILESSAGVQVTGRVNPELSGGLNYQLTDPMDAGLTEDLYRPTALKPLVPFKIKVRIGTVTYLPIEMKGNFANLGLPGQKTQLDLTLGEDTDGDGLPDAWERALIELMGGNRTLADIRPEDDADRDGLSNLQEYLAGTYAYDPSTGLTLDILQLEGGVASLEFMAVQGRTYTVETTRDMETWATASFRIGSAGGALQSDYQATDVRLVRVEVPVTPVPVSGPHFFRLRAR